MRICLPESPFAFLASFSVGSTSAFAYLDPGTGSMLLQAIIGGVAASFAAGAVFWQKLKVKFSDLVNKKPRD